MISIRKADVRGHFNHGWLNTYHTFSFADYYDNAHMGFRALRVINEDRVQPGQGFGTHAHRDMEIITYVLEGSLEHRDSLGNGSVINAGDLQRMTAGTGVQHSEFNPSDKEWVHFYQIWLFPRRKSLPPSYEQHTLHKENKQNQFILIASPNGAEDSLTIQQDASLYIATLGPTAMVTHSIKEGRAAWLQVLRGAVKLLDNDLTAGSGVALTETSTITVAATDPAEVLLFDLA
jgi:quercetin 2,3-dioxygenase